MTDDLPQNFYGFFVKTTMKEVNIMKRLGYVMLSIAMMLFAAGLFAPQAFAADLTSEQLFSYQNLTNGITVMDNGTICAAGGSSIKGFNADGTVAFSISLPAKCGNLCASGDYLFAAGYMSGHMNDIYVLKPGDWTSCKTLDAGQRAQAVTVDYDGNLYCVNSTGTGNKTKILRAKISDVVSLSSGSTIEWTKEYEPGYTPLASDGKCYPQGIAVDGRGNIYIADKGAYNGYEGSVDGIYKYDPVTDEVSAMFFTAGSTHRLFTWVYDICADDYGTVAVIGRYNYEVAVFKPGSTSADAIINVNRFIIEGVGRDKEGNIYINATNGGSSQSDTRFGIYKINMGHVAVNGVSLSDSSKSIDAGKDFTLTAAVSPSDATNKDVMYSSSDVSVASVDASGNVSGIKAGKATITVKTVQGRKTATCEVTVNAVPEDTDTPGGGGGDSGTPSSSDPSKNNDSASGGSSSSDSSKNSDSSSGGSSSAKTPAGTTGNKSAGAAVGSTKKVGANSYKVLSKSTVAFSKAKNKKSVTVPASVKIGGTSYKVTQITANAFKGSKIKTVTIGKNVKVIKKNAFKGSKAAKLILKTKLLRKAKVKLCLKGSKIKTVQVKVGKKSVNKTYVKKYKKIFTKKNAGRKVKVK